MNTTLKNFGKTVLAMTSALLVGTFSIPACSSGSSSTVRCGTGTTKQGDQCVGTSDDGGLVDATSEAGSDAGSSSDGNVAADAPPDGDAAAYVADPCPTDPIAVNCASTCSAGTTPCGNTTCKHTAIEPVNLPSGQPSPSPFARTILRTPDQPAVDPECTSSCMNSQAPNRHSSIRFGMSLDIGPYGNSSFWTEVRVGPPWRIEVGPGPGYPLFCPYDDPNRGIVQKQGCALVNGGETVLIWTDDPNAPSRNVYIHQVADMAHGCQ